MSRIKTLAVAVAVALGWAGTAAAGPMLTGAVTYDRATQLYTYSYTLDDRAAPSPIDIVSIRVATHVYDVSDLTPISYTVAAPFTLFFTGQGGWDHPEFPGGTFYMWDAWWSRPNLSLGVHSGLSFTSRYGPGNGGVANYELYSRELDPVGTQVQIGLVVAPDLTHAPEPGTLAIVAVGLAAVGLRRARRSGRASQSADQ
jgi:hypothetical protein